MKKTPKLTKTGSARMDRAFTVIAVASQKGGTGKSILSTALAGALKTLKGLEVTLYDADPQRTTSEWYESARHPPLTEITLIEHTLPDLHKRAIAAPGNITLIDCPGAIKPVLTSALEAADFLLVPCRPSHSDARSLPKLASAIKELKRPGRAPLQVGVVLNQVRIGPKLERRTEELRNGLPENFYLFETRVRRLDDFDDAFGEGCTPLEHRPKGAAAADLTLLANELLRWINSHA